MSEFPRRVDKPWGYELIWADTEAYVGKLLHVNAGEALSVQYHEQKDETLYLLAGRVRLWAAPLGQELEEIDFQRGQSFRVRPRTVHRMIAVEDSDVLEASTPHLDDVVRIEDRYGRVQEAGKSASDVSGSAGEAAG